MYSPTLPLLRHVVYRQELWCLMSQVQLRHVTFARRHPSSVSHWASCGFSVKHRNAMKIMSEKGSRVRTTDEGFCRGFGFLSGLQYMLVRWLGGVLEEGISSVHDYKEQFTQTGKNPVVISSLHADVKSGEVSGPACCFQISCEGKFGLDKDAVSCCLKHKSSNVPAVLKQPVNVKADTPRDTATVISTYSTFTFALYQHLHKDMTYLELMFTVYCLMHDVSRWSSF